MNHRPVLSLSLLASCTFLFVACATAGEPSSAPVDDAAGPPSDSDADAGGSSAKSDASRDAADANANALSTCDTTRAWVESCKGDDALNCGASFDAWCASSDDALNSEAYRAGVTKCYTGALCDKTKRDDCAYRSYSEMTPTAAQKALVAAYCATCSPDDPVACAKSATTYDPNTGPVGVPDIFIAAWELKDSVVDEVRASCTGTSLDAGTSPDAGVTCERAFALCAGDIYLAHMPDCP